MSTEQFVQFRSDFSSIKDFHTELALSRLKQNCKKLFFMMLFTTTKVVDSLIHSTKKELENAS